MIYGITLILLSLLAVPSLILAKKPNAQELLNKIAPYQGWIGLVFCFWGIWGIISCILHLNYLSLPGMPVKIWWLTWLAASLVEATLGFILGYGTISSLVLSKNETAKQKGEQLLAKLAPIQGKLGVFGIIIGIWVTIAGIMYGF